MKSTSVRPRFHSSLVWFALESERSGRIGRWEDGEGCSAITQLAFELCLTILAQTGMMTSLHSPVAIIWWKVRESALSLTFRVPLEIKLWPYTAVVWVYCVYRLLILNKGGVFVTVPVLMTGLSTGKKQVHITNKSVFSSRKKLINPHLTEIWIILMTPSLKAFLTDKQIHFNFP